MPAYNFQKQFATLVKDGEKRSTIRARRANGYVPEVGEKLTLYTGMRTRACKLLRKVTVKRVRPIVVNTTSNSIDGIILDGDVLGPRWIRELALADGFKGVEDFARFFNHMHGPNASLYLIEW